MSYGAFHPYPRRFGGGKPLLQTVHESLNAQRGTAYDATNPATTVWLVNHAIARAIVFDGWGTNERLANQWDPDRMTDMLPRWERIMRINVPIGAQESDRRRAVKLRCERFGQAANHGRLTTEVADALGPTFVAIEYISAANAVVHVPDGSYPWGTVSAGSPWYSTVAHILVRMQKPPGWTEGEFLSRAGKVVSILDPITPSWATFDWYRAPAVGAPVFVVGGPSAAGFYLDEPNLDLLVFDT